MTQPGFVAQLVERRCSNPEVVGSNPAALTEEKSTPLNFSYFPTQLSLKILAKQGKTAKKMLAFHG